MGKYSILVTAEISTRRYQRQILSKIPNLNNQRSSVKTAVFLLRYWSWWNKNMGWVVLLSTEKSVAMVDSAVQTEMCLLLPPSSGVICFYFLTHTMKEEWVLAFYKAVKFVICMFLVVFLLIFPCPLNHYHRFSLRWVLITWIWNTITLSYIFNSLPSVMSVWMSCKFLRCYQFIIT